MLTLDGGGAKWLYTLGVLRKLEGMLVSPLCERLNLIFGTSTGAIIAAHIAFSYKVGETRSPASSWKAHARYYSASYPSRHSWHY